MVDMLDPGLHGHAFQSPGSDQDQTGNSSVSQYFRLVVEGALQASRTTLRSRSLLLSVAGGLTGPYHPCGCTSWTM